MLKIVHLLTGVAALLLSFIPSLQPESLPYLEQHDALYLALFGLLNLTLAPVIPYWNKGTRHQLDRKSTRLNSSHGYNSYAVSCLQKKKKQKKFLKKKKKLKKKDI